MAFSSGTFSLYTPGNPVVTGTTISSTWANNTLSDIATGLSTCVLKDGTQTITANIPLGGFIFTGLGAGSSNGHSLRYQQLFNSSGVSGLTFLNPSNIVQALVDGATVSWDTSTGAVATLTISASRTMGAPTNLKSGGEYRLIVTQGGAGGFTLAWNAVFKAQGGGTMPQPETTAGAVTIFDFTSDGTNLYISQQTPFMDSNYIVRGATDPTKKVRIEADSITTATTRVLTFPDNDLNLASANSGTIVAGPATGSAGNVTVRAIVGADASEVLIGSVQTASSSSTIDFTATSHPAAFDGTLGEVTFHWQGVRPGTDSQVFEMRTGTGAGPTYASGAADYLDAGNNCDGSANTAFGSTRTYISLSGQGSVGNAATKETSGYAHVSFLNNTAFLKVFRFFQSHTTAAGSLQNVVGSGQYIISAAAITGVRFLFASGNIAEGKFWVTGKRLA